MKWITYSFFIFLVVDLLLAWKIIHERDPDYKGGATCYSKSIFVGEMKAGEVKPFGDLCAIITCYKNGTVIREGCRKEKNHKHCKLNPILNKAGLPYPQCCPRICD